MKKATITLKLSKQTVELAGGSKNNILALIDLLKRFKIDFSITYLGEDAQ